MIIDVNNIQYIVSKVKDGIEVLQETIRGDRTFIQRVIFGPNEEIKKCSYETTFDVTTITGNDFSEDIFVKVFNFFLLGENSQNDSE